MRRLLILVCSGLLISSGTLWAGDIVAAWKTKDGGAMTLSVRDDNHIRMDTAQDSYTLLTGDKVYMVHKDEGRWQATDMAQLAGMMGMFGKSASAAPDSYDVQYESTGRRETIAGYSGKVYRVTVRDGGGKKISSDEAVLSKSADILRINMGLAKLSEAMGSAAMPGMSGSLEAARKHAKTYGSVLRYGQDMALSSVTKTDLGASYFQLPATAEQQTVTAPAGGSRPAGAASSSPSNEKNSGFLGGLFKESADTAKDEAERNSVEQVKKGVGNLFKSVFNSE